MKVRRLGATHWGTNWGGRGGGGGTVGEGGGMEERDRGCQVRSEVTIRIERWYGKRGRKRSWEKRPNV